MDFIAPTKTRAEHLRPYVLLIFSPFHFYLDTMLYDATHALAHTHAPKHAHTLSQRGEIGTHTDPHLTIYY